MLAGMRTMPMKPESLEERLAKRIARKRGDVFLREDFSDLSGSTWHWPPWPPWAQSTN